MQQKTDNSRDKKVGNTRILMVGSVPSERTSAISGIGSEESLLGTIQLAGSRLTFETKSETTSAGIKIEQYRVDRSQRPNREEPNACLSGDSVYYLPGKIKISHMRKLRQVARGPSGRTLMHRLMVRGHWRRPNPNWKNQSLRWIEPYWRGPSLASIIEREYRVYP